MDQKKYEIKGKYQELHAWKPFTKVLSAPNERQAQERIYNLIGSKHRLKRMYIQIDTLSECAGE